MRHSNTSDSIDLIASTKRSPLRVFFRSSNRSSGSRDIRLFILVSLSISLFASLLNPLSTYAATSASSMSLADKTTSYAYVNALRKCLKDGFFNKTEWGFGTLASEDAIKKGDWFDSGSNIAGSYLSSGEIFEDGRTSCNNIVRNASTLWGYSSPLELACTFVTNRSDGSSCASGAGKHFGSDEFIGHQDDFYNAIKKNIYDNSAPTLTTSYGFPGRYLLYLNAFTKGCSPKESSSARAQFKYTVTTIDTNGNPVTKTYEGVDRSTMRYVYTDRDNLSELNKSCADIASELTKYAPDYEKYLANNRDDTTTGTSDQGVDCQSTNSCSDTSSSCQVEGIGWILCPVVNAMAGMTDATFGLVSAFMRVEPLGFATDNPMYQAWAVMRNIANVAFTIAFLIIVFSQLTGIGISNYGVKKMLPRLVIAAILVNLSYFICALAVDASNILGYSIQNVLTNLADTVGGAQNTLTEEWGSIATSVLSLGAIGTAGAFAATAISSMSIWAMLAGLLPLLIGALFALIIAFLVLLARQAFIIILIVIAPLAFVAYLLPNTQDLFKKWRVFLTTLLALFPMMALVFGGSVLASSIMRQGAEVSLKSGDPATVTMGFFIYLGSVAVLAIPFFITPLLIKLSSGVLNRFAGFINNPHKGPFDRMRKGAERVRDNARNRSYAQKLSGDRKILSFGARRRNRKALYDKSVTNSVEAAEAGALFTDQKASNLSMRTANTNQLASTLQAEHKAEFEKQKDGILDYRQKLADQQVKARGLSDQAAFDESKTDARPVPANSPIARQIEEARRSQRAMDVSNSQIRMAGDVSRQELAKALEEDSVLAVQMGGVAGQRGAEKVKAEAQFTLQKAVMEEVEAERTQVAKIANTAQLVTEYNNASSGARRAAIAARLITVGKPTEYESIVNSAGANLSGDAENVVLRKTIAKALSESSQLFKASDIDAIETGTLATRENGGHTLAETVSDNMASGVLSQEKMVAESNDNLRYGWSVTTPDGKQRLMDTAAELIANDVLRGKIKHNGDVINSISTGQNP